MKIDKIKQFEYECTIGELDRFRIVSDAIQTLRDKSYLEEEFITNVEREVNKTFERSFISKKFRNGDQDFFFRYFIKRKKI